MGRDERFGDRGAAHKRLFLDRTGDLDAGIRCPDRRGNRNRQLPTGSSSLSSTLSSGVSLPVLNPDGVIGHMG